MRRAALFLLAAAGLHAQDAAPPTTRELLERLAAMEATIHRLEAEVKTLQAQPPAPARHLPPLANLPGASSPPATSADFKSATRRLIAPDTKITLSLAAQADLLVDSRNPGARYDFVTSTIPVRGQRGYGGGIQSDLGAKASSIDLLVEHDTPAGPLGFHYRNDFFGSGNQAMEYNLKDLYGVWHGMMIGYTTTTFFDRDALPNTLDYEGPNSLPFIYNPQIRYTARLLETAAGGLSLLASLEGSEADLSGDVVSGDHRTPDGTVNLRWTQGRSHLRAGALLRSLAAQTAAGQQDALGWALAGSGSLALFQEDALQFWGSLGRGYAAYIQDTAGLGLDAVVDSAGALETLPACAVGAGYLRQWTPALSSTASAGYVSVDSDAYEELSPYAMGQSLYLSANLAWQINPHFLAGVEYLYGQKRARNGAEGDVSRVQMTLRYSFDHVLGPLSAP